MKLLKELLTEVTHPKNMGEEEFWRWRDKGDVDPRLTDEQAIAQYDNEQNDAEWEATKAQWDRQSRARTRYKEQVATVKEYLSANKNDFVSKVLDSSGRYGSFTDKQWAMIEKIINRKKSPTTPKKQPALSVNTKTAGGGTTHKEILHALVRAQPNNGVFSSALRDLESGPLTPDQLKAIRHGMYRIGWKDKASFMK